MGSNLETLGARFTRAVELDNWLSQTQARATKHVGSGCVPLPAPGRLL